MKIIGLFFLVVVISASQTEIPTARQRYEDLGGRLFEFPAKEPGKELLTLGAKPQRLQTDEIAQRIRDLRALTTQVITGTLNAPSNVRAPDVRKIIEDLQGSLSGRHKELGERGLPYAQQTKLSGATDSMVVAFAVLKGPAVTPAPDPFIQFYIKTQTGWVLGAESTNDLEGRTIQVATLQSPNPGEIWVMAWGVKYGDNRARLSVRLYAFNTNTVHTLWSRDDLPGGEIEIHKSLVVLKYYEMSAQGDHPPREVREELQLTPNGLQ